MDEQALKSIITTAIQKTLDRYEERQPAIVDSFWMGAIDIAPENLAIWFLYEDGQAVSSAKYSGLSLEVEATLRRLLDEGGYPVKGIPIGFDSKKAVDDAGGKWKYFR